ncbi:type II secretion system F family protein [Novosphingobium sp.]|uniref:type II secretion system F family protein n=1 Tax=Novosphingobium sp. TaxID=1874826 RepID=UPI0025DBDEBD|nr:type II secretion system F family protein [Novosphingobium sp.]
MTGLFIRLFVLVAVFASIFLLSQFVLGFVLGRRAETKAINRRLQLLRSGLSSDEVSSILRKDLIERPGDNAGPIERLYYKFQRLVRMGAVRADPRSVLGICTVAFAGLASLILFLTWSAGMAITAGVIQLVLGISGAIAFGIPIMVISRMAEKRRKRMQEQFPVSLDIFVRALRAGHPVASAIDLLTKEMEDPLGSEMGLVSDEVSYGANLTDALSALAERWDLDDIRMFVVSLSLQSETGGNLAEILGNLAAVIRDRASMYMKVRALSSEGRMSGWMLTVLPVFTLVSMFLVNARFYLEVATDPIFVWGFGILLLMYFFGVWMIRRMIDLKV